MIKVLPGQATLADRHKPKKHAAGSLKFMDVVFYKDATGDAQRYFIEAAPKDWMHTAWVRVTDRPLKPNPDEWPNDRQSFAVHADMLDLAPPVKNVFTSTLPTPASVERKVRAKAGVKDVGDPVAVKLRSCKDLPATYKVASKYLRVPVTELVAKYEHLNPGGQRMNLGNRMRNQFKKTGVAP